MTAAAPCPYFEVETAPELQTISLKRDWTFENVPALEEALTQVSPAGADSVLFRCGGLENIDIAGAWVLYRRSESLREGGVETDFKGFKAAHFKFLEQIQRTAEADSEDSSTPGTGPALTVGIQQLGKSLTRWIDDIGAISAAIFEGVRSPGKLALRETLRQLQISGLQAVPVVALIGFLMGLVMAYQGALQLKQFGATVFVVDLVAISVLREMGVVMAAIMVAREAPSPPPSAS
ncbi:MAG: ABC transporter permease [Pseudomonadota bacterium]